MVYYHTNVTTSTARKRGRPRASERTAVETRAQLLDGAAEVFAERGYRAATVDEIVAKAGLSKGTFYWHFESKEELFAALLEERVDRPARALMEVTRSAPVEGATAPEVSHGLATLFRQQRGLVLLLHEYWSAAVRDERLRARYLERQSALRDALARALAARHARTGVPLVVPADDLATAFIAFAEGLSREALLDPESVEEGLLGEIFSLVYDGMAARASDKVAVLADGPAGSGRGPRPPKT
jgi:AcrR family transcriptional regulator